MLLIFISSVFLFAGCGHLFAQETFFLPDTAVQLEVADRNAAEGDIISEDGGELRRANSPYDNNIFGVVAFNPIVVVGRDSENSLPIVTSGVALVKVDGSREKVEKGDFITSSNKPGVGQKALYPGFVIGRAMEELDGEEGLIEVFVDPRETTIEDEEPWQEITFWEAVGRIIRTMERDAPQILRYLLAALFVTGSFVFGLYSFSRTLKEGIKGISRNPLAKGSIRFAMILNLIGILILTLSGIALALFVILL